MACTSIGPFDDRLSGPGLSGSWEGSSDSPIPIRSSNAPSFNLPRLRRERDLKPRGLRHLAKPLPHVPGGWPRHGRGRRPAPRLRLRSAPVDLAAVTALVAARAERGRHRDVDQLPKVLQPSGSPRHWLAGMLCQSAFLPRPSCKTARKSGHPCRRMRHFSFPY